MTKLWINRDGKLIVGSDGNGRLILCDNCPCDTDSCKAQVEAVVGGYVSQGYSVVRRASASYTSPTAHLDASTNRWVLDTPPVGSLISICYEPKYIDGRPNFYFERIDMAKYAVELEKSGENLVVFCHGEAEFRDTSGISAPYISTASQVDGYNPAIGLESPVSEPIWNSSHRSCGFGIDAESAKENVIPFLHEKVSRAHPIVFYSSSPCVYELEDESEETGWHILYRYKQAFVLTYTGHYEEAGEEFTANEIVSLNCNDSFWYEDDLESDPHRFRAYPDACLEEIMYSTLQDELI